MHLGEAKLLELLARNCNRGTVVTEPSKDNITIAEEGIHITKKARDGATREKEDRTLGMDGRLVLCYSHLKSFKLHPDLYISHLFVELVDLIVGLKRILVVWKNMSLHYVL